MSTLTIGQLAKSAGIAVDTIRYYERSGLLEPAARRASGYREYGPAEVERLLFIRSAKRLGFTLDEVRALLVLVDGHGDRAEVRALAEARLASLDAKLVELRRVRATLAGLVDTCRGHGPADECPIVEAVIDGESAEPKEAT